MLPEGLHVVESQGERLGILPEKCPPSSAELAEIISEPRRDHKSQGEGLGILPEKCPPSEVKAPAVVSRTRRDHK